MSGPILGVAIDADDARRTRAQALLEKLRRLDARHLNVVVDADKADVGPLNALLAPLAGQGDVVVSFRCAGGARAPQEARRLRDVLDGVREHVVAVELRVDEAPVAELVQAARQLSLPVALGGACATPQRIEALLEREALKGVAAISVDSPENARRLRDVLAAHDAERPLWLALSPPGRDDGTQHRAHVRAMLDALDAPVDRVYWSATSAARGVHTPLIDYVWSTRGIAGLRELAWLAGAPAITEGEPAVVVTGGAGFVGTNLAHRLLETGTPVVILDNLSRAGTYENVMWLRDVHGDRVRLMLADVRDESAVRAAVANARAVVHLAAQVAVTTSLEDPRHDFEVNARGVINLLEALREREERVPLIFTSTNKVYGAMEDVKLRIERDRHVPEDAEVREHGFDESRPLDFHSPYGCSKGAADQYVLDYARTFGIPSVVFRMSCIYGPHQHGTEDQGWVAHFLLANMRGEPITIYGDGRQVRDVLFVDDLVDAFLLGIKNADRLGGRAFNLGGGPGNTLSLLELVNRIEGLQGRAPDVRFAPMRPGDQPYYVSDTRAFQDATGWEPKVGVQEGLRQLQEWLAAQRGLEKRAEEPPVTAPARPAAKATAAQNRVRG